MRVTKKSYVWVAAVAILSLSLTGKTKANDDIVTTAVKAGAFKTLAAALKAANLVEALKGKGPFTVFAPTDAAFAKLPKGTVESLIKPENRGKLTKILTYHVVSGNIPAAKVVKLRGAKTLNGQRVNIKVASGKVSVDNATVVKTDIRCSNGIIHVIDRVVLPASDSIPVTAKKAGKFKTLLAAAKAAGLDRALAGKGPFTVFAPTDDAFAKLPKGTVASLLKPKNKSKLIAVLKYHVVKGRVFSEDALAAKRAKTLQGHYVHVSVKSGKARINQSNLIATDIDASNGVIHVIDSVLLPPQKKKVSANDARRMIERAVARGAHLYNKGHHAACAKIYMQTMSEMVAYGDNLPKSLMTTMTSTMSQAKKISCATTRAWTLRHGLDHAYHAMRSIQ